jgi:hypothetical protein
VSRDFVRPRRPAALDGGAHFGYSLRHYASSTGLLGLIAQRSGIELPAPEPPYVDEDAPPAIGRVYHDRWITDCPEPGCGDASFVWLDALLYMCANCFNEALGGRWRRVEVPDAGDRRELEGVLAHRALPQHRNWAPGETAAALRAQNAEQGESVPGESAPAVAPEPSAPKPRRRPAPRKRASEEAG